MRRHLVDKVPVSDLCDEYHLQPSVFYTWQRQSMENLATALEAAATSRESEVMREGDGLARLDRIFGGQLQQILEAFNDALWQQPAA